MASSFDPEGLRSTARKLAPGGCHVAGSPTKVHQTCTMLYAAKILICCCRNSWQNSLIIFGSIGTYKMSAMMDLNGPLQN
jgi:hypothetical protein